MQKVVAAMSKLTHIRTLIELFNLPLKGRYEMAIIALAYNFDNKGLRISNGKLAKTLHTSSRTIERAIARLRQQGLLRDEGTGKNDRCLRLSTDIMSGLHTDTMPVVDTDIMSGEIPTSGGVSTDMTADHKEVSKVITKEGVSFVEFMNLWNSHGNLPKIHTFTKHRKRILATRSKEPEFAEKWRLIVEKLSRSPFHTGQNNRKWRADIDWLLKNDTNYVKILELVEPDFSTREVSDTEAAELMAEVSGDS